MNTRTAGPRRRGVLRRTGAVLVSLAMAFGISVTAVSPAEACTPSSTNTACTDIVVGGTTGSTSAGTPKPNTGTSTGSGQFKSWKVLYGTAYWASQPFIDPASGRPHRDGYPSPLPATVRITIPGYGGYATTGPQEYMNAAYRGYPPCILGPTKSMRGPDGQMTDYYPIGVKWADVHYGMFYNGSWITYDRKVSFYQCVYPAVTEHANACVYQTGPVTTAGPLGLNAGRRSDVTGPAKLTTFGKYYNSGSLGRWGVPNQSSWVVSQIRNCPRLVSNSFSAKITKAGWYVQTVQAKRTTCKYFHFQYHATDTSYGCNDPYAAASNTTYWIYKCVPGSGSRRLSLEQRTKAQFDQYRSTYDFALTRCDKPTTRAPAPRRRRRPRTRPRRTRRPPRRRPARRSRRSCPRPSPCGSASPSPPSSRHAEPSEARSRSRASPARPSPARPAAPPPCSQPTSGSPHAAPTASAEQTAPAAPTSPSPPPPAPSTRSRPSPASSTAPGTPPRSWSPP